MRIQAEVGVGADRPCQPGGDERSVEAGRAAVGGAAAEAHRLGAGEQCVGDEDGRGVRVSGVRHVVAEDQVGGWRGAAQCHGALPALGWLGDRHGRRRLALLDPAERGLDARQQLVAVEVADRCDVGVGR
jgi:hypothetical protein